MHIINVACHAQSHTQSHATTVSKGNEERMTHERELPARKAKTKRQLALVSLTVVFKKGFLIRSIVFL